LLGDGHTVLAIGNGSEHAGQMRADLREHERSLTVIECDLTNHQLVEAQLSSWRPSKIDGLVNCAGTISNAGIEKETAAEFESVLRTNLLSAFNLSQLAIPFLESADHPAIVNVSSICSLRPCNSLSYSVSKAGLDMFTRCMARDLAAKRIRVNVVNPSVVRTNLQMSAGLFDDVIHYDAWVDSMARAHPLGRVGEPVDVTGAIRFFLSREAGWITGASLVVDGGRMIG
jgi:NAD(P)-dependent dehydrogenase (short-subunit alcohol dehydrogenase family)